MSSRMTLPSTVRRINQRLQLEKLEDRHLLSAISPLESCDQIDLTQLEAPSVETSGQEKWSQGTSMGLRTAGQRFFRQRFANLSATEDLGMLDDAITVEDSQGSFDWVDRYQFQVQQPGQLNASLQFENPTLSILLIFDESRNLVIGDFTGGDANADVSKKLEGGTYFVLVFRGHGKYQLDLELSVDPAAEQPVPEPPANRPDAIPRQPVTPPNVAPITSPQPENNPSFQPLDNVPYYGGTFDWNLNAVNAPEAWNAGYLGDDIVVAVIDTGVNINHNDLNDNIWQNVDEIAGDGIDNDGNGFIDDRYGWNFVSQSSNVLDDNGHGTHVAGTIAAEQNGVGATGVAPNSQVMSIKTLNAQGSGFFSAIANGIRYAVDNGADIINLSLGGPFSSVIASAISYAANNDVLIVAASGNEGARVPGQPASLSSTYSSVLSVGAYDSAGAMAGFSNGVGNSGAVQVDAPGVSIFSTSASGGYQLLSGTSMATPHVAGLAALTLSANPNLTAANLRNIVVNSSNRTAQGSDASGAVNAAIAIPHALAGAETTIAPASSSARVSIDSANQLQSLQLSPGQSDLIRIVSVETESANIFEMGFPILELAPELTLSSLDVAHVTNESWVDLIEQSNADETEVQDSAMANLDELFDLPLDLIAT